MSSSGQPQIKVPSRSLGLRQSAGEKGRVLSAKGNEDQDGWYDEYEDYPYDDEDKQKGRRQGEKREEAWTRVPFPGRQGPLVIKTAPRPLKDVPTWPESKGLVPMITFERKVMAWSLANSASLEEQEGQVFQLVTGGPEGSAFVSAFKAMVLRLCPRSEAAQRQLGGEGRGAVMNGIRKMRGEREISQQSTSSSSSSRIAEGVMKRFEEESEEQEFSLMEALLRIMSVTIGTPRQEEYLIWTEKTKRGSPNALFPKVAASENAVEFLHRCEETKAMFLQHRPRQVPDQMEENSLKRVFLQGLNGNKERVERFLEEHELKTEDVMVLLEGLAATLLNADNFQASSSASIVRGVDRGRRDWSKAAAMGTTAATQGSTRETLKEQQAGGRYQQPQPQQGYRQLLPHQQQGYQQPQPRQQQGQGWDRERQQPMQQRPGPGPRDQRWQGQPEQRQFQGQGPEQAQGNGRAQAFNPRQGGGQPSQQDQQRPRQPQQQGQAQGPEAQRQQTRPTNQAPGSGMGLKCQSCRQPGHKARLCPHGSSGRQVAAATTAKIGTGNFLGPKDHQSSQDARSRESEDDSESRGGESSTRSWAPSQAASAWRRSRFSRRRSRAPREAKRSRPS